MVSNINVLLDYSNLTPSKLNEIKDREREERERERVTENMRALEIAELKRRLNERDQMREYLHGAPPDKQTSELGRVYYHNNQNPLLASSIGSGLNYQGREEKILKAGCTKSIHFWVRRFSDIIVSLKEQTV